MVKHGGPESVNFEQFTLRQRKSVRSLQSLPQFVHLVRMLKNGLMSLIQWFFLRLRTVFRFFYGKQITNITLEILDQAFEN
jgi:hypothetical protein